MKNKPVADFEKAGINAKITVSRKIRKIDPVVENIANNLAEIDAIHFIRVSPGFLQASSETTEGRLKTPITRPGHPTAIGVSLIIDFDYGDVHFFEMTSAIKGYGQKMVDAVLNALPQEWNGVVVMDWSDGFWDKMKEKHRNLVIL
jgi:hypothetical protein